MRGHEDSPLCRCPKAVLCPLVKPRPGSRVCGLKRSGRRSAVLPPVWQEPSWHHAQACVWAQDSFLLCAGACVSPRSLGWHMEDGAGASGEADSRSPETQSTGFHSPPLLQPSSPPAAALSLSQHGTNAATRGGGRRLHLRLLACWLRRRADLTVLA